MVLSPVERGLLASLNTDPAPCTGEVAERMGMSLSRARDLIRDARTDGWILPAGYHLTGAEVPAEAGDLGVTIASIIKERADSGLPTRRKQLVERLGLTQAVANFTLSKMRRSGCLAPVGAVVLSPDGRDLIEREGNQIADIDTILDTVVSWPGTPVAEIAAEVGCTPAAAFAAVDVLRSRRMISSPRFQVSDLPVLDWPYLTPPALFVGVLIARANSHGSFPTTRSIGHQCEYRSNEIHAAIAELRAARIVLQDRPYPTSRGESHAASRLSKSNNPS